MSQLPQTEDTLREAIDVRLEARVAFGATAQYAKFRAYAEAAEQGAEAIRDGKRMLAAAIQKASALNYIGAPEESLGAAEKALRLSVAARAPQVEAVARCILGSVNFQSGGFRRAVDLMGEAERLLVGEQAQARLGTTGTTLALVKVLRGTSLASLGEFDDAALSVDGARAIAGETRRPYDIAAVAYGNGYAALLQGRIADAVASVEPAIAIARKQELAFFLPVLGNLLGQAYVASGRLDDGVRELQAASHIATELGHAGARLGLSLSLGVARLASAELSEAEALIGSCLDNARQQGYRGIQANAARQMAVLRAKLKADEISIGSLFDEAIAISQQFEARPSAALAMLARAEFLAAAGESATARSSAFLVEQEFRQMKMIAFLARASRILA